MRHVYIECPDGFTYIEPVNGCYKVVNNKVEWPIAGLECRALHPAAHLLVINDAVEQSAVASMLTSANGQFSLCVAFFILLVS